jgi:hypothetical protein
MRRDLPETWTAQNRHGSTAKRLGPAPESQKTTEPAQGRRDSSREPDRGETARNWPRKAGKRPDAAPVQTGKALRRTGRAGETPRLSPGQAENGPTPSCGTAAPRSMEAASCNTAACRSVPCAEAPENSFMIKRPAARKTPRTGPGQARDGLQAACGPEDAPDRPGTGGERPSSGLRP